MRVPEVGAMADAGRVAVGGRDLRCQYCSHAQFYHRTAKLDHVAWAGLLHFEGYWGHHTDIYVCARCGFSHFFMPVPSQSPEPRGEAEVRPRERLPEEACLSCGKQLPPAADKCPACGWTWSASEGEQ